jgi:hypothetical protein
MASETFLTYRKSNNALPIARDGNKTIYISQSNEEEDEEEIMNYARSIDIHKLINENPNFTHLKPREKDKLRNELILHLTKRIPPISDDKRQIYDMIINGVKKGELKTQIVTHNILQPIPSDRTGRSVYYVAGGSGSGKSHLMAQLAMQYNIEHQDRPVYLFSFVENDKAYDNVQNLYRIPLTPELMDQEIEWSEYEDSFIIFDDYNLSHNKKLIEWINLLVAQLLTTGRHMRASLCITSHQTTDYRKTRLILAEATHLVIYVRTTSRKSLEYLLSSYTSLSREDISQVFKLGKYSRYIIIHRSPPCFIQSEHSVTLI